LDKGYYFSFDGKKGVVVDVQRDDRYIESLIAQEIEFWDCVQNFSPPKLSDKDYVKREDDLWKELSNAWLDTDIKIEDLNEKQRELRIALIRLSGDRNSLGNGVRLRHCVAKGRVDYKKVTELRGIDLEPYRGSPIESWTLSRM